MAITKGSVTIDGSGNATGSGITKRMYDLYIVKFPTIPSGAAGVTAKQQIADLASLLGEFWADIETNAEVSVQITTSDSGLQRMPASTAEDTPTKAPGSTKTLNGTIT